MYFAQFFSKISVGEISTTNQMHLTHRYFESIKIEMNSKAFCVSLPAWYKPKTKSRRTSSLAFLLYNCKFYTKPASKPSWKQKFSKFYIVIDLTQLISIKLLRHFYWNYHSWCVIARVRFITPMNLIPLTLIFRQIVCIVCGRKHKVKIFILIITHQCGILSTQQRRTTIAYDNHNLIYIYTVASRNS